MTDEEFKKISTEVLTMAAFGGDDEAERMLVSEAIHARANLALAHTALEAMLTALGYSIRQSINAPTFPVPNHIRLAWAALVSKP